MSEENVEIVHRGYDAWNRGDLRAFVELATPDATWYPPEDWPDEGILHGREEITRLLREVREPLERNEAAAEKIVEGEECVVVAHVWRGVIRGTEDEIEARRGMTLWFREGKVSEVRFFPTFTEALEAGGLSE